MRRKAVSAIYELGIGSNWDDGAYLESIGGVAGAALLGYKDIW